MKLLELRSFATATTQTCLNYYQYNGPIGEETLIDIFDYAIKAISDAKAYEFVTKPISSGHSLLSTRAELSMVLEQLPNVICGLTNDNVSECFLGLYEQGANLRLRFYIKEDLSVESQWLRVDIDEVGKVVAIGESDVFQRRTDIIFQLKDFAKSFADLSKKCCPSICSHPLFVKWLKNVGI